MANRISEKWRDAMRQMLPKAPFSLDQLEAATGAKRNILRAQVWAMKRAGYLRSTDGGRYDFTSEGIDRILS